MYPSQKESDILNLKQKNGQRQSAPIIKISSYFFFLLSFSLFKLLTSRQESFRTMEPLFLKVHRGLSMESQMFAIHLIPMANGDHKGRGKRTFLFDNFIN